LLDVLGNRIVRAIGVGCRRIHVAQQVSWIHAEKQCDEGDDEAQAAAHGDPAAPEVSAPEAAPEAAATASAGDCRGVERAAALESHCAPVIAISEFQHIRVGRAQPTFSAVIAQGDRAGRSGGAIGRGRRGRFGRGAARDRRLGR